MRGWAMITRHSTGDELLAALHWFFGEKEHGWRLQELLEDCRCGLRTGVTTNADGDDYVWFDITLFVPPSRLTTAQSGSVEIEIGKALDVLVNEDYPLRSYLKIKVLPPEAPRTVGLNNCFFNKERTHLHDELRFRSKAEVAIYEELKRRDVLIFPNPAAVLGVSASEYGVAVEKREPDLLVCFRGKWGILEVNHDDFHSGIVTTNKEHERARKFQHYGVFFIQAYDYDKCRADPVGVVDEFLKLLANHK
jgi:hypothetical protein